jgi:two-component system LytT family sensor kinase
MIAPMLFIPFIENSFKHAGNKKADNTILIMIRITPVMIDFYCENYFNDSTDTKMEPGGIGNDLIEKRLRLLYPGRHRLQAAVENNLYKVHLSIYSHEN